MALSRDFSFLLDNETTSLEVEQNVGGRWNNRTMKKTNKNSKVVVSHTTPRKVGNKPKLAPAGCRTIDPVSADQIELNFVARVELLENGCWLWHGSVDTPHANNKKPVPTFWAATSRADHKIVRAYAYAYKKRIGELPDQKVLVLRNACGLDVCANPYHYEITPRKEILANEATPVMLNNLKTATKCKSGLHDKTPENTAIWGAEKKSVCLPCYRLAKKEIYKRNKAKAEK